MIREKVTLHPTIKVNVAEDDETSVEFNDEVAGNSYNIISVQDIPTRSYGNKTTMTLHCINDDCTYNIFLNVVSSNNLIDAFGMNDDKWKGKKIKLSKEKDKKFNKDMIVVTVA